MDNTTLESLEYGAVLAQLSARASTPYGREICDSLLPKSSLPEIEKGFKELREVVSILDLHGVLPLPAGEDIRPLLEETRLPGVYLEPEGFLLIKSALRALLSLGRADSESFRVSYPLTSAELKLLSDQSFLCAEMKRIFDDKGHIADRASTPLYTVRKELRGMRTRVRKLLGSFIKDDEKRTELQDDFFSIRDDRYVLAVKVGFHTRFKGIIHGRSSSGETYFIEPYEVVELNNSLSVLKRDERVEEARILRALTTELAKESEAIACDLLIAGRIDFSFARAALAKALDSVIPELSSGGSLGGGGIRLQGARHPLLILKERAGDFKAVPVEIHIDEGVKVLVISGANTGGKTVALKTLGLLTLMAQSGLCIPAREGARIVVFETVAADIGDRQGIDEELSTFSAHVKRTGEFLLAAEKGGLVLIDEIGVGTDPTEGGALALSLLETLARRGAVTVCTTHLNLLKAHASIDPDFMNASVIFDATTLEPSYDLSYGVPGPSLGLSIARSLGMPDALIKRAEEMIGEGEGAFIESVRILEEERDELRRTRDKLARLEEQRDLAIEKLRKEKVKIVERLKKSAEKDFDEARAEVKAIVTRLKEKERDTVLKRGTGTVEGRAAVTAIEGKRKGLLRDKREAKAGEEYIPKEGDRVEIEGSAALGIVERVLSDTKEVELKAGMIRMRLGWSKLKRISSKGAGKSSGVSVRASQKKKNKVEDNYTPDSGLELNIIGRRTEEAMPMVTRFLDDALTSGFDRVYIIHGRGTGALGRAVRESLSDNPSVASFCHAEQNEGGAGVTIVTFK